MKRASIVFALLVAGAPAAAQESRLRSLTLDEAIAEALAHHPRIAAAHAEERVARARVDEAHVAELPGLGVSAQVNRSTGNTVPGAFFMQPGFAPIAGPTRGKTFDGGVWQSGASLWASWDVLSLTRQAAAIDVALASTTEAEAATAARKLEVAYRAADAFLLVAEAGAAVRVAKVNVARAEVLRTVTKTLTDQSLRPGADAARAEAELAVAETQLVRADQGLAVRRAGLAEAIGDAARAVDADAHALLFDASPRPVVADDATSAHPDVVASESAITRAAVAERLVGVQYLPRIDLVATLWARGSGLFDSPAGGLVPDVPNWAAGATITWSILDVPAIRARARVAAAVSGAARARRDETVLAVKGELAGASAILEGAARVSKQTGPSLWAARAAEEQAAARFKTGLAAIVDVAGAERLLAQAELDDAIARLELRRAELLVARAVGDLGPFLARARIGASHGGP